MHATYLIKAQACALIEVLLSPKLMMNVNTKLT